MHDLKERFFGYLHQDDIFLDGEGGRELILLSEHMRSGKSSGCLNDLNPYFTS